MQIGDSHTANDSFSGRLRELFQARFGDAGRGVMPPGCPVPLLPAGARVGHLGGLGSGQQLPRRRRPFGITGLRQHADGPRGDDSVGG